MNWFFCLSILFVLNVADVQSSDISLLDHTVTDVSHHSLETEKGVHEDKNNNLIIGTTDGQTEETKLIRNSLLKDRTESYFPYPNDVFHQLSTRSNAYYINQLIAPGRIPQYYLEKTKSTPLKAFNGRWEIILSRSDSMDSILTALGVSRYKRHIMADHHGYTDITVFGDTNSVIMQNHLPFGIVVGSTVPLTGEDFHYHEKETGSWLCKAFFINGTIAQVRTSPKGTMYDVRAVFPSDPDGVYDNHTPLMLFKWTFLPIDGGVYTTNRWLRRI